ncbi:VPS9 domain-containing protein 1-like [Pecten maximus]|uniref:VPS9 domain-containing protein 1-like n=1 Tax=Pecten maximus TaxID=6579 RepID=UPI00145820B2|nr:VPS9 domain-containing protein 1-like [Pecten maximus]
MESAVVLTTVMKGVADALRLDGDGNRPKEAYVKYLECIFRIATKLLQNVKSDGGQVHITKEVVRLVRLGSQSMERMVAIINQFTSGLSPNQQNPSVRSERPFLRPESKSAPATPVTQTCLDFSTQDSRFRLPSVTSPLPVITTSQSKQKTLTPSEIAMMKNHQLMIAYKTRMGGLGTRKSAAASLSLTLQRKIAENLAIAKAQEEALAKKIQERQHRLEEQAAKKFNSVDGMSEEEEQKKEIYKKVLEYEQDTSWLTDLRQKLEENPDDAQLMQELILGILKCSDHPLSQQLKLYQFKVYEKIHPLVSKRIEDLSEIKVPLSVSLFPAGVAETWDDSEGCEADSDSDSMEDEDDVDDQTDVFENDEQSVTVNENEALDVIDGENDIEDKVTNDSEEGGSIIVKDIEDVSSCVKKDLEIAIEKGESLKTRLKHEYQEEKKILRQVSNDIEKYSLENMDDLFDDDDDDDDDDVNDDDKDVNSEETENSSNDKWLPPPYSSSLAPSESNDSNQLEDTIQHSDLSDSGEKLSDAQTSKPSNEKSCDTSADRRHSSRNKLVHRPRVEHVQAMDKQLAQIKNEAYHRHLKGISQDVQIYLEKIQALFTMTYEQLDSPAGQDQCYACLEKPFFQPIWQYLMALYRLANEPKERAVAYVMTRHQHSGPKDFNVSKKLRLDQGTSDQENNYPYHPAVAQLQAITTQCTLLDKLECLVRSSRLICQCVEDHYKGEGKVPSVGADDLLPILCYVIVKAAQPQIVSECHIMEEFIHEGYIMGEEGYCLTSLQTALAYLTSLGIVDQS